MNKHPQKILYISYDGICDPIGKSQILPYIFGCDDISLNFHILSFEKKTTNKQILMDTRNDLDQRNILWTNLSFTSNIGMLGKFFDLIKLIFFMIVLLKKDQISLIHARGHISAIAALVSKVVFGVDFLFDYRGMWIEERIDKGSWHEEKFLHRLQIRSFKKLERIIISKSAGINVLTRKMKSFMIENFNYQGYLSVIPCCVDFELFKFNNNNRSEILRKLNIPNSAIVMTYLGSSGGMYDHYKLFNCFSKVSEHIENVFLLFITNHPSEIQHLISIFKNTHSDKIRVTNLSRAQIPDYLSISSLFVTFNTPGIARISMSPTKVGEALAVGLPIIADSFVGDLQEDLSFIGGCHGIDADDRDPHKKIISMIERQQINPQDFIRNNAKEIYSLEKGVATYNKLYNNIFQNA